MGSAEMAPLLRTGGCSCAGIGDSASSPSSGLTGAVALEDREASWKNRKKTLKYQFEDIFGVLGSAHAQILSSKFCFHPLRSAVSNQNYHLKLKLISKRCA